MSTQNRKVGYYNFEFEKRGQVERFFDRAFFKDFIDYVMVLPSHEQVINIPRHNKAVAIDRYAVTSFHADFVVRIVFKSCKYNHSPEYMSSRDGSERNSDKKQHEGEKEKTHLCIRISSYEASLLLEERRNGVTINEITNYLNKKLKEYLTSLSRPKNLKIIYGTVPSENFLAMLETMEDIKVAEVITSKVHLGSEAMGVIEEEDHSMKEEVLVTMKAKPKESMAKRTFRKLFNSITANESKVSRIRLYGRDSSNNPLRIDSEPFKKVDYVVTELDDNGTVNTDSIFEKMFEVLDITGTSP
ncbi:hypothetical protein [Paenibacillus sp. FSL K6-1558]|uniref:hypothetical protein n=1 Tax=Paenibacillus sp. FSL K6-1558 TaxID=2921473 RepID=UPI0030F50D6E